MTEKQLQALIRFTRASIAQAADPRTLGGSIEEQGAEALMRNAFGLHQHSDKSGPHWHPDHPNTTKD